jgi:hypothetical protein
MHACVPSSAQPEPGRSGCLLSCAPAAARASSCGAPCTGEKLHPINHQTILYKLPSFLPPFPRVLAVLSLSVSLSLVSIFVRCHSCDLSNPAPLPPRRRWRRRVTCTWHLAASSQPAPHRLFPPSAVVLSITSTTHTHSLLIQERHGKDVVHSDPGRRRRVSTVVLRENCQIRARGLTVP